MLNELFTERWSLLLDAIREADAELDNPRAKLGAAAGFIIESYRHDPELMKVIIVEVTRAANSFGRTHLPEIRQAYDAIAKIVADAQADGEFRDDVSPDFASMLFYGAIEQLLTGWIFEVVPAGDEDYEQRQVAGGGDDLRRARAAARRPTGWRASPCGRASPARRARTGSCTAPPRRANVLFGLVALPLWLIGQLRRRARPRPPGAPGAPRHAGRCRCRRPASARWRR